MRTGNTVLAIALAIVVGLGSACGLAAFGLIDEAHASTPTAKTAKTEGEPSSLTVAAVQAKVIQSARSAKSGKPSKKAVAAFKKASAAFSLDLFGRCVAAKGKNANVTVAPMSVMNALAIAANGAAGKTSVQMRDAIAGGASMSQINANLKWYNSRLAQTKKAKLNSANAIWYDNGGNLKVRKAFLSAAKKYYGACVSSANFSDTKTVKDINRWVAKKTSDMIKKVIDRLDRSDRLVIVNALGFDAEWAVPYEKSSVLKKAFRAANGKKRKVQMMYGVEHAYIQGKNVTGFVKPYAAGYSYVALLPKKGMSLKSYVSTLNGDTFRKLISSAAPKTVFTALPKYSISYSNGELEKQLAAMGMSRAFSPKTADFSKMGTDGGKNLYLGTVAHKTKIDLDERGTKAAAATTVIARAGAAYDPDAKTVTLNRPFIYAIVDNNTKLPVFIGTVNDIGK